MLIAEKKMEKRIFNECISEIFDVNINDVDMKKELNELDNWDSFSIIRLLVELHDNYGVDISIEDLSQCIKVEDLYNLCKK